MLEGSQKLLLPWSLMSNVKLSGMLVSGHFCQRCHVRWFLTAYWRVRAWVDAKCSFFSSKAFVPQHPDHIHPFLHVSLTKPPFTLQQFFLISQGWFYWNDSHVMFFWRCWLVMGRWPRCPRHLIHHRRQQPHQPNQPDTCEDVQGGERFTCEYPSIKIFNMGCFTIVSTCFTESGSKTENG